MGSWLPARECNQLQLPTGQTELHSICISTSCHPGPHNSLRSLLPLGGLSSSGVPERCSSWPSNSPWRRQLPAWCVLALCNQPLLRLDPVYGCNWRQEGETETRERVACKDELPAVLHETNMLPATFLSAFLPSALWENKMESGEEKSQKALLTLPMGR